MSYVKTYAVPVLLALLAAALVVYAANNVAAVKKVIGAKA
ncbi:MAG: hypothetical protein RLZZ182_1836 [Pseudomonadota bacterium]|jgi:hypothetical protein